uniref:Uncharacterized protein n=1 Tax=Anguilla anguilla TaxID=7936 RepID=A0A0E9W3K6_ANGAN
MMIPCSCSPFLCLRSRHRTDNWPSCVCKLQERPSENQSRLQCPNFIQATTLRFTMHCDV